MSDQSIDTTTSADTGTRGPVAPAKPDVSGFSQRKRGRRLAAAQRGTDSSGSAEPTAADEDTAESADRPEKPTQSVEQPTTSPRTSGHAVAPTGPEAPAPSAETVREVDSTSPHAPVRDRAPEAAADAVDTTVGRAQEQYEDTAAEADEDDEDDGYVAGKTTRQTYVPDAVATRFRRLQQTGKTAETIVLTAVENCADRVPSLIQQARGPVQEGGLFPGLPVIDGGNRSRSTHDRPNNARIQYQVSPEFMPALLDVARRHKLKLSKLVRLALGDYFGVPVRLNRAK